MERLQKVLAHAGVASRRASELMISAGRVAVNGRVVTELGTQVDPERDAITVDGKPVQAAQAAVYILVNKPAGYVSTTSDPQGRPTVLDLIKQMGPLPRLYPVGRLDADSEGLLLLTNDGTLTERMTHPRYGVEKEYLVRVAGRPAAEALARLRAGVPLDGRPAPVDHVEVASVDAGGASADLRITVHEGRKHEIRRLCELVGHPAQRLQRVRLGAIKLGSLALGAARPLTKSEVISLHNLTRPPARPSGPASPPGQAAGVSRGRPGRPDTQQEAAMIRSRRPHANHSARPIDRSRQVDHSH